MQIRNSRIKEIQRHHTAIKKREKRTRANYMINCKNPHHTNNKNENLMVLSAFERSVAKHLTSRCLNQVLGVH